MQSWLDMSAVELAQGVREGTIDPVRLVDVHVARIRDVNPKLNALVVDRFDAAREEAATVRERHGDGALAGVPCTVKEFFAVEGLPQTAGIARRRGVLADVDATVVKRIRDAGAILLGTSNVPEGGLWMETYNVVYGRTSNPWDLRRTSGGSSGGEGALVAAGCSPFGIGSDIGGSIRIPAAFCGVPGHKPSGRLVPNTGQFPPAIGEAAAFLSVGPLARRVRDLRAVLRVIEGPDGEDAVCTERFAHRDVDVRGMKVLAVTGNARTRIRPDLREGVTKAAKVLADRGADVREASFPALRHAFEIWAATLGEASDADYKTILGEGEPIRPWRELGALLVGRSEHSFAASFIAAVTDLLERLPSGIERHVETGRRLREEIEAELGDDGVLLYPPYSRTAPRHRDAWRTPFDFACTAVWNVLELPVTVVPVGFSRGLPVGVQVIGKRGRDATTLAAAQALEDALGGWVRAPV